MDFAADSTVDAGEPMAGTPSDDGPVEIREDRLEKLGIVLAQRRDEWIKAKSASGVEKRWLEDYDQYMGRDDASKMVASMMDSAQEGFPVLNRGAQPQRSTLFINITRPKTNTAEARVANMLLPTDDRNFGLQPSPSPELTKARQMVMAQAKAQAAQAQQAQQPGAQPAAQPMAQPAPQPLAAMPSPQGMISGLTAKPQATPDQILDEAEHCSRAMQTEVDDQLSECNWNGECRAMIHEAAVLGTGIIKGPIVASRIKKSWTPLSAGGVIAHVMETSRTFAPESYAVSPWNVLTDPACGNDPHSGSGIYEMYEATSKMVRELVKQPGYIEEQISQVLRQGPKMDTQKSDRDKRDTNQQPTYKVWEYWGEFDPEDLRAAGVDVEDDSVELVSGCVIMVNDIVVKGFLNPSESGDLPYDFFQWEQDAKSPYGYGVPYLCRPAQRALNAAWRQLMDNSGNTIGPIVILKPNLIQPVDKQWTITGNKLFNCMDDTVDVRTCITAIDIPNHGERLMEIIKMAKEFMDEESMVPQLQQGEHGNAPDTVGGMTILVNSNNVVLARITKQFDDKIIMPHIGRYIDWNMAYSDKPEIKGDHQVQARGTSSLLVRDIQNQTLIQFGQFQGSGVISPMVNWEAWIKAVLKAQHVDPTEILKSDEQIQQLSAQPPQASDAQIRSQATVQAAQIRTGGLVQSAQLRAQAMDHQSNSKVQGELAYAQTEAQIARDNHAAKLQELQWQRDLAMLNYAQQHNLTLEQIKADLAKTSMIEGTKRQLAAAEMQLKSNESHADRLHEAAMQPAAQPIQ